MTQHFTVLDKFIVRVLMRIGSIMVYGQLCVIIILLLFGCATEEEFARANATHTNNYPSVIVMVSDADHVCRQYGTLSRQGSRILGCADSSGSIAAGFCVIFIDAASPAWVLEHEKLHCKYGSWHP